MKLDYEAQCYQEVMILRARLQRLQDAAERAAGRYPGVPRLVHVLHGVDVAEPDGGAQELGLVGAGLGLVLCRLRPSIQPNRVSPSCNAASSARDCGSFSVKSISTPTRRMRPGCCARATGGHAAALPSPAMNARRLIE
jgi:hypothetical protein